MPAGGRSGSAHPSLAATAWAVLVSPQASYRTEDPLRLVVELIIFGSAVAALAAVGSTRLTLGFGAVVVIHLGLTFVFEQR